MSYIVYHPDTGTIMAADDSCLVDIDDLPPDFDDWEEYLAENRVAVFEIVKGKELL